MKNTGGLLGKASGKCISKLNFPPSYGESFGPFIIIIHSHGLSLTNDTVQFGHNLLFLKNSVVIANSLLIRFK